MCSSDLVIIFFLALFSMVINWKDPFVRYLTILSIIALLISFGRTFPFVYDLMFNYFPAFDKFRVPSMILVLVQLSFPILAGLGIAKIISAKKEKDKRIELYIRNIFFVLGGFFLLTLLLGSPIKEWFTSRVNEYVSTIRISQPQKANMFNALSDYMANIDRKSTRLNSSHIPLSRMPSSA